MNKKLLLQQKKEQILAIAAQYGASNIRIFGSVAKGKETPESDIDFLVELAPDRTLLDQIGLIQSLQDLLKCNVDLAEEDSLHSLIKEQILQDAISL
jgi:predicted nucleotidyltransferase